jgi:hypothetical protein
MRSETMALTISSETSLPASITALARLPTSVCGSYGRTQHVAGGKLGNAVLLHDPLGLGPLTRTRRP